MNRINIVLLTVIAITTILVPVCLCPNAGSAKGSQPVETADSAAEREARSLGNHHNL